MKVFRCQVESLLETEFSQDVYLLHYNLVQLNRIELLSTYKSAPFLFDAAHKNRNPVQVIIKWFENIRNKYVRKFCVSNQFYQLIAHKNLLPLFSVRTQSNLAWEAWTRAKLVYDFFVSFEIVTNIGTKMHAN